MNSSTWQRNIRDRRRFKKYIISYFLVLLLMVVFTAGFFLGAWKAEKVSPSGLIFNIVNKDAVEELSNELDFNLFWQVWQKVDNKHLNQPISDQKLFYGAISGLVDSLDDPHSAFMDPETTEYFNQAVDGNFEGIGAEIGIRDEQLTIIAPLEGTPAHKAGLKTGDRILKIDDQNTADMTLDYAVSIIRGEKGSEVILTILSQGQEDFREVAIIRGLIELENLTWELLDNNIALIELSHFNVDTDTQFNKVANEIILKSPKGLIVDLRGNPGGFVNACIDFSSYFIEKDIVVVIEKNSDGEEYEYKTDGNAILKGFKTVVLINQGSASASEIFAGAMQDYGLATLVGQTTFGKGSIQDYEEFGDGSSLKLTVANWLTPNKRLIESRGIVPDYEVEYTLEDAENEVDPQLEKAVEIILE